MVRGQTVAMKMPSLTVTQTMVKGSNTAVVATPSLAFTLEHVERKGQNGAAADGHIMAILVCQMGMNIAWSDRIPLRRAENNEVG
jgi:hypothetical protein